MRVAVIVPGIMGSVLWHEDATGKRVEIWGENFYDNYRRILTHPELLRWDEDEHPANASVLEKVYVSDVIDFVKVHIWDRMLDLLTRQSDFKKPDAVLKLGYDWRRSLADAADDFAQELNARKAALATGRNPSADDVRFTFITHSLGGLLLRCAIAKGLIQLASIERIIHIGAPLQGAPKAFAGLYKTGGLPFLHEFSHFFHLFRNAGAFFQKALETVQTFPSSYQLLPPVGHNYLFYSAGERTNPFVDPQSGIPQAMIQQAADVHNLVLLADQMIHAAGLSSATYTVYTEQHGSKDTDSLFHVAAAAGGARGYKILDTIETEYGDGTVPASSARGRLGYATRKAVENVSHATMCNDKKVVGVVDRILNPI